MKNYTITLFLFLLINLVFAQNSKFEYYGRFTPTIKQEKLNEVNSITDISPQFWRHLAMSNNQRNELEKKRKIDYALGCYMFPLGGYNMVVDYLAIEIVTTNNGKLTTYKSTSDKLTKEQKSALMNADLGSAVQIKIKFKLKNKDYNTDDIYKKIMEGQYSITIVPAMEAEFPGGFKQISAYLNDNFLNKITQKGNTDKIRQTSLKFTINEEGKVVNSKIFNTSSDIKIDQLLLEAINKMPKWKPAKNSKGIKVKQEFIIPFGGGGC
jgi:hypothetical protein